MFIEVTMSLLEGFGVSLAIFTLTLLFAIPLGLVICLGSMCRFVPVKWLARFFVWVIRGTPLMLQLIAIYYGPGLSVNWAENNGVTGFLVDLMWQCNQWSALVSVVIAFVINYACYFSEIYRGGIEAVPGGQYEAGMVLGMTRAQIFFRIVLLQVIRSIIPPMSNEVITLVKDTSLARVVTAYEIIWAAQKFIKLEGIIWPLFYAGAFYLIFSGLLTLLLRRLEKKLDYYKA